MLKLLLIYLIAIPQIGMTSTSAFRGREQVSMHIISDETYRMEEVRIQMQSISSAQDIHTSLMNSKHAACVTEVYSEDVQLVEHTSTDAQVRTTPMLAPFAALRGPRRIGDDDDEEDWGHDYEHETPIGASTASLLFFALAYALLVRRDNDL